MKILRLLGFTIIILGMLLGSSAVAQTFSVEDVSGPYAYVFDGYVIVTDDATMQTQSIPTSAVGQIVFNTPGDGEFTITAVQNLGGFALLNFTSPNTPRLEPGTYTIDPMTGIATVSAPVVLTAPPSLPLGALPPGFSEEDFAGTAVYELQTVINASGVLDVIGTSLSNRDSAGVLTPIGAFVGRGTARPQEAATTQ